MELIQAAKEDFQRIREFYQYVIDNTDTMRDCCRWEYGKYPSDEIIQNHIANGDMYFLEKDGKIVAGVAVIKSQPEKYHGIAWQKDVSDAEVVSTGMLCVDPDQKGQGIGRELVGKVCAMARAMGKKSYRLDALASNTPAHAFYEALGFKRVAEKQWDMSNVGWTDFVVFEKII